MSRAAAVMGALAALAVAGCGGEETDRSGGDPFASIQKVPRDRPLAGRTAPRWERVASLAGSAAAERGVGIARGAIQWRARWRCEGAGRFVVRVEPPPRSGPTQDAGECPGRGSEAFIGEGPMKLAIAAAGAWRLTIEQQVQTPLREPPLPAMTAHGTRVIARGAFYGIERRGKGTAALHELAGGRLALRLEGFETAANTDLFVWLSRARRPRTTRAVLAAPYRELAGLKATTGDQNYLLPPSVAAEDVASIVIWCEPVQIAYTAASLAR